MLKVNSIYQGDCLELIKDVDDNSVPLVIADPPYFKDALNFFSILHIIDTFNIL